MVIETRQILEELQLKEVLATSATGAVFLAEDPASGRDVVIKLVSCSVPGSEDEIRGLFLSMAEAARKAEVPAMPRLTDHGLTPEGDGFLVMERLPGEPLDAIEELDPVVAVSVVLDVLGCVEGLAGAGTAHLNLTSNNVLVIRRPGADRAVVVGFGTAATILHAGFGVPVPADDPHLAPELVAGNVLAMDQAWRSDLFSLGVIACSALGAEIEGDGYERPRITLPAPVRASLGEVEPLETVLGQIMDPDPMRRGDSPSEVRDPLIRALPDLAAVPLGRAPVDGQRPSGVFDPNKTDPAYEPPPPPAAAGELAADEPAGAGNDDHGWPEILFDDPELPTSLGADDGLEDTDITNPVPEDVWVPPAAAEAPHPEPITAPSAGGRRVPRWELALVSAVVIILGSIIAFTWPRAGREATVGAAPAVAGDPARHEPLVPPPPDPNLFDDLLAIQRLVESGDLDQARRELDIFDQREAVSLSSDEQALYDGLVTSLTRAVDRESALADLRGGLARGSVTMLRRAVPALSELTRDEVAAVPGLANDLSRARTALRHHGRMWQSHKEGDHLGAITAAGRLVEVLPGYTTALEVRGKSAEELEARAEGHIVSHEYPSAVAVLESLLEVWPDRDGVASRIGWCRDQIDAARRTETAIARAVAMGDGGDPEGGLEALAAVPYDPRLQAAVEDARSRLHARLAELDARPPVVELAGDGPLTFKKNEILTVPVRVSDDLRVERVVAHARNESDADYLQIPLEPSGGGVYTFTVSPDLHGNQNVYFYVVARDPSGNLGRLGAQDAPITIERSRWFKKILD